MLLLPEQIGIERIPTVVATFLLVPDVVVKHWQWFDFLQIIQRLLRLKLQLNLVVFVMRCNPSAPNGLVQVARLRLLCSLLLLFLHHWISGLFEVVNKVATRSVGTKSDRVVGSAQVRLVLGVPGHRPQFGLAMCELAFLSIFAGSVFRKRPAKFRLVAGRVHFAVGVGAVGGGRGGGRRVAFTVDLVSQPLQFADFLVEAEGCGGRGFFVGEERGEGGRELAEGGFQG